MTQNQNTISGTVQETESDNSTDTKDIIFSLVGYRDIALILGFIGFLQLVGIIQLPFISQFSSQVVGDIIVTVLTSALLAYATVWQRFKKVLDQIYNKQWVYLILSDASGDFAGAWKTDPETLRRDNDAVEFKGDSEVPKVYREAVDKAGRRYALIKSIEPAPPESDADWILENIQGWDEVPADDQIIAEKTSLEYWMDVVLPQAQKAHDQELSKPVLKETVLSQVVSKFIIKFENASDDGTVNMTDIYEEIYDSYESLDNSQDNDQFIRENQTDGHIPAEYLGDTDKNNNTNDRQ